MKYVKFYAIRRRLILFRIRFVCRLKEKAEKYWSCAQVSGNKEVSVKLIFEN